MRVSDGAISNSKKSRLTLDNDAWVFFCFKGAEQFALIVLKKRNVGHPKNFPNNFTPDLDWPEIAHINPTEIFK